MSTHLERAAKMYGNAPPSTPKPAAKPAAPSKPAAAKATPLQKFDRVLGSFEPFLVAARSKNDRLEAERLEQVKRETAAYCAEMGMRDDQAMQFVAGMTECMRRPREDVVSGRRKTLVDNDREFFVERYGAEVGNVMQSAATRSNALLTDKPALLDTVRRTGSWLHRDVVEAVAAATVQAGAVKPIEAPASTATT